MFLKVTFWAFYFSSCSTPFSASLPRGRLSCSPCCTQSVCFSLQQSENQPAGVHSAYLCSLTCTNSLFLQATAEELAAIITIRRWMWPRESKWREKECIYKRITKVKQETEGGESAEMGEDRVRRKRRRRGDKIKVRSCPRPQPAVEFVRGGGRRKREIINEHLSVSNKSASSSSSVGRSLPFGEGYIIWGAGGRERRRRRKWRGQMESRDNIKVHPYSTVRAVSLSWHISESESQDKEAFAFIKLDLFCLKRLKMQNSSHPKYVL